MNPIDELSDILAQHDVTQAQQEALVDLIVWTMYVDGAIRYEENEQVDSVVDRLDSFAGFPLRSYLYTSIARMRDVWHDSHQAETELDRLYTQLQNDTLRRTAYTLSETVARADGELAGAEQTFLQQVRRRFGLAD